MTFGRASARSMYPYDGLSQVGDADGDDGVFARSGLPGFDEHLLKAADIHDDMIGGQHGDDGLRITRGDDRSTMRWPRRCRVSPVPAMMLASGWAGSRARTPAACCCWFVSTMMRSRWHKAVETLHRLFSRL